MTDNAKEIFSNDFIFQIRYNSDSPSEYAELIKRYVRNEEIKITEIPLDLDEELLYLNNSIEVFFFTPIILYILRELINENTSKKI